MFLKIGLKLVETFSFQVWKFVTDTEFVTVFWRGLKLGGMLNLLFLLVLALLELASQTKMCSVMII